MITREHHPVEWSLWIDEAADAVEHLTNLLGQVEKEGHVDEEDLRVQLGHVYAHLNRLWHGRAHLGELSDREREAHSTFPSDVPPVG